MKAEHTATTMELKCLEEQTALRTKYLYEARKWSFFNGERVTLSFNIITYTTHTTGYTYAACKLNTLFQKKAVGENNEKFYNW
jgi:hypothetical protein